MDFVSFCGRVLLGLVHAEQTLPYGRDMGVEWPKLFKVLFEGTTDQDIIETSPRVQGLMQAHRQLSAMGFIDSNKTLPRFWSVPRAKRLQIRDLTPVWREICARQLDGDEERLLRLVNELGERQEEDFAWLDEVAYATLAQRCGPAGTNLTSDRLEHVLQDLESLDLVRRSPWLGSQSVHPTYSGLVWTTRRGNSSSSRSSGTVASGGLRVFYVYSHKDERLLGQLQTHLASFERNGLITGWSDRKIGAGRDWENEIAAELEAANIILLLVSADFLASDYCQDIEMKRALERHDAGEATVIPIILRPVHWTDTPLRRIQALPDRAKPVTTWRNRDEAWASVASGIRNAINDKWSENRT